MDQTPLDGRLDGRSSADTFSFPFDSPSGICISFDGRLFVSDRDNHVIRMIYNQQVTTVAGSGKQGFQDGNALEAIFANPGALCLSKGRKLFVIDINNHRVRMIHKNQVTTIAGNGQKGFKDGNALEAMFSFPMGICASKHDILYVSDTNNHSIRMINHNQVSTVAGNGHMGFRDGNAEHAMFSYPEGICISKDSKLYISDSRNYKIRMVHNNQVTTIAGNGELGFEDGNALQSMFYGPEAICISNDGRLYVSDFYNSRIRMIHNDQVITIAGNRKRGFLDENVVASKYHDPFGMCISRDGRLYMSDKSNHRIKTISVTQIQKSPFGFSLLLDMRDNILCDSQISFNDTTYHLHSTLVNVRCPLLFEKSYYSLILQSNISNESFESFLTFLYSNKLTKEHNEIWPANMTIKNIVELIFVFDVMMNCKWIIDELNRRFRKQLIEILHKNEQECVRELIVDVLPYVYRLQEISKTKPANTTKPNISFFEYCYNMLLGISEQRITTKIEDCHNIFIHELQKKQSTVIQHLTDLENNTRITRECYSKLLQLLMSETTDIQPLNDDQSAPTIVFGSELTELSKLAFCKTNLAEIETAEQSSISTQHLDKWTTPDFVIKLSNDDISYHVHKLILCGRWKYFCQMIGSGLKEANDNEMTLSDDWNKSRFEKMMKYIYLNEIEFESIEDVEWLMENRKLYGITVGETGSYGFEELYEYCIYMLD